MCLGGGVHPLFWSLMKRCALLGADMSKSIWRVTTFVMGSARGRWLLTAAALVRLPVSACAVAAAGPKASRCSGGAARQVSVRASGGRQ